MCRTSATDVQPHSLGAAEACIRLVRQALEPPSASILTPSQQRREIRARNQLLLVKRRERRRRCHQRFDTAASTGRMREPTGNEEVYNDQDRRSQWTDFVELASSRIAEEELLQQLDRGIGEFGWRYPHLYEALFRQSPAVYYMLERARTLGITFGSCMAGSSSRRQSHIKRAARVHALTPRNATSGGRGGDDGGGGHDDACPALLVMAGMQPTMFICKDANFGAPCIKLEVPPGKCGTSSCSLSFDSSQRPVCHPSGRGSTSRADSIMTI